MTIRDPDVNYHIECPACTRLNIMPAAQGYNYCQFCHFTLFHLKNNEMKFSKDVILQRVTQDKRKDYF